MRVRFTDPEHADGAAGHVTGTFGANGAGFGIAENGARVGG